jgi:predicted RNA-binding protein with PUA-like domain
MTVMQYWLFKTEPSSWSWDEQVAAGAKGTFWSGVRNHTAKQNLQRMKAGDRGFFYHSGEGKAVVGVVEVMKEYYPDHTDKSGQFGMVDLKAVAPMPDPVTLQAIKAEPKLKDMALVKYSRLSVQPVAAEEWALVCRMGGYKG